MTTRFHANNISTTLTTAITSSSTTLVVASATGLPTITSGQVYRVTLTRGNAREICEVTAASGTSLTVTRAIEGTTAQAFAIGTNVEIRITADSVDRKLDIASAASLKGYTATATAAATTTLTVSSTSTQIFTGSTTQTCVLPVVSTLTLGTIFTLTNLSTGVVTVQSSGANTIQAMQANSTITVISNAVSGTGATVWYVLDYSPAVSGQTGSGSLVRATSPTFVTPILGAATATSIAFSPSTGGIIGTATNDNAGAGKTGETITSVITSGSAISNTSSTAVDITSISLTAGDWDVWGNIGFTGGTTTTIAVLTGWISLTSATVPDASLYSSVYLAGAASVFLFTSPSFQVPAFRFSLSGTTTIYLSSFANFGTSTCTSFGGIYARRVR